MYLALRYFTDIQSRRASARHKAALQCFSKMGAEFGIFERHLVEIRGPRALWESCASFTKEYDRLFLQLSEDSKHVMVLLSKFLRRGEEVPELESFFRQSREPREPKLNSTLVCSHNNSMVLHNDIFNKNLFKIKIIYNRPIKKKMY